MLRPEVGAQQSFIEVPSLVEVYGALWKLFFAITPEPEDPKSSRFPHLEK